MKFTFSCIEDVQREIYNQRMKKEQTEQIIYTLEYLYNYNRELENNGGINISLPHNIVAVQSYLYFLSATKACEFLKRNYIKYHDGTQFNTDKLKATIFSMQPSEYLDENKINLAMWLYTYSIGYVDESKSYTKEYAEHIIKYGYADNKQFFTTALQVMVALDKVLYDQSS